MIKLKRTRNIVITGLACACFLCACAQPQESLQGFSEDGTLEAADSAKEVQQTDITYDELLQSWENQYTNYTLNEPFDSFFWDCTGLHKEDGIASMKQSFTHTANQIAELIYEQYDTKDFADQLYEKFVSDDTRIIDKNLDTVIADIPEAFAAENADMEIKDVTIDYMETFFVPLENDDEEVLYEQANMAVSINMHGQSADLAEDDYTATLFLHFARKPVSGQDWKLTYIGGDEFYIMAKGPKGIFKQHNDTIAITYDGQIVDNWSVLHPEQ